MRRWLTSHPRRLAVLLLVALLAAGGLWLRGKATVSSTALTRRSYDWLHALALPWQSDVSRSPVVLVFLDIDSYLAEQQDPNKPWDRALHAKLVNRLTRAGARAVVFDIIFSGPSADPEADRQLIEAMRANGRVIIAGELAESSQEPGNTLGTRTHQVNAPAPHLADAAAGWGLANLIVDEDFVVRRYFAGWWHQSIPSLTLAAAQLLHLPGTAAATNSFWLRYYGRALSLPHVSYAHALDPNAVPDEFFRDKIVFVGARPMTGSFTQRRDEFRSPFPSWRRQLFLPAVEVHATQMLNLVRQDGLRRLPPVWETGLLLLCTVLLGWGLFQLRPVPATGVALLGELVLVGAAVAAFVGAGVWFPWLVIGAAQLPVALGASVLFHSLEWYRERRRLLALRRAAETRIKEQAALIDAAQDAILVRNLDGRIVYANPSATQLFGWNAEEIQRDGVSDQLFAPAGAKQAEARQATLNHGEWQGELQLATRTGQMVLVESRWTLIRDEQGRPKSMLLINTDVTEKKQLESQLLRTQRLEAIWSLAGGMAHDLNNTLAPVLMGLQRLRRKTPDAETERMLSVMEANTQRGAEIVRQVLTFSRGREGEHQLLQPAQLLRDMERIAAQTFPKSISVAVLAPPDVWPVRGNATQLHQVLLNLCVNARDAMPEGGELTLAADNVELSAEEAKDIPNARAGEFVMLLVSDTGTGIPPDVLPRLFEPFFTTKPEGRGTGLGLSTSAHIIRQHGGFINVKSDVGEGTTFEIYLPRATPQPAEKETVEPGKAPLGQGELILVIDDDRSVTEMLSATLQDHGYRVVAAANGAEGLAALDPQPERGPVRLVLLDHDMPVMNGPATLAAIRETHPQLPVVLMSGSPGQPGNADVPQSNAHLAKPFRVDDLLRLIREELNRGGQAS